MSEYHTHCERCGWSGNRVDECPDCGGARSIVAGQPPDESEPHKAAARGWEETDQGVEWTRSDGLKVSLGDCIKLGRSDVAWFVNGMMIAWFNQRPDLDNLLTYVDAIWKIGR